MVFQHKMQKKKKVPKKSFDAHLLHHWETMKLNEYAGVCKQNRPWAPPTSVVSIRFQSWRSRMYQDGLAEESVVHQNHPLADVSDFLNVTTSLYTSPLPQKSQRTTCVYHCCSWLCETSLASKSNFWSNVACPCLYFHWLNKGFTSLGCSEAAYSCLTGATVLAFDHSAVLIKKKLLIQLWKVFS